MTKSSILIGRPHRTLTDLQMLVYDYDQVGHQSVMLPAGSIFQPWQLLEHWRGEKVPITLGQDAQEFDWGVTAVEGHFLHWHDFFAHCELIGG